MNDEEKLEAIRREIEHARMNGHRLSPESQGVDFQKPPEAVRSDYLLAILNSN